jgi:3-hydroxyacyl-[acyl-carrier-protein] dehydratase
VFVDRVTKLVPGKLLVGERDLRVEEPQFAGHFPGRALMPGVLVTEALAQASGLLIAFTRLEAEGRAPDRPPLFFLAACQMKFTHPAVPGETLVLRVEGGAQFGQLHRFQAEATVGRHLVASGNITLANMESASGPEVAP